MTFRVGDRVRINEFAVLDGNQAIGDKGTVREVTGGYYRYKVETDGETTGWYSDVELDLILGVAPDPVNHPEHYNNHPSGVECISVTEHMNFCLGNAVKYLWRVDSKGDDIENLRKAAFYIDREIKRREAAK